MLTGKYSNINNYTTGTNQVFNTTEWTFPKELRANGYWTGLIGSYGLTKPQLNATEGGFDFWNIQEDGNEYFNPTFINNYNQSEQGSVAYTNTHVTTQTTELAIDALKATPDHRPWFMMMS